MIASFDELTLQCASDVSRLNIRESIRCYELGAYRAAIVSSYIAVSFDLIEKLRTLAAANDDQAKSSVETLTKLHEQQNQGSAQAIAGLLTFERNLLELFRDRFEFFGANEFEELARMRADRNRCAHPTFSLSSLPYVPSAELARLHIRNALVLVLTQPPRQGKAALESLRTVVLSPYFPADLTEAHQRLQDTELSSARPSLLRAFVDDIAFGWPNPASPYHGKKSALVALQAVVELNRAGTLDRVKTDSTKLILSADAEAVRFGVAIALRIPESGEDLSGPAKPITKNWLKNPESPFRANAICAAFRISWLVETAKEAALTLTIDELATITAKEIPAEVVQRTVDLYSTTHSWDEANKVADKAALPFAPRMTVDQIRHILQSAQSGASDLQGSNGFRRFLDGVAKENTMGIDGLNNLLLECSLEHYSIPKTISTL